MKKQMKWLSGVAIGCLGFTLLGLGCLKTPTSASAEINTVGNVDVSSFTMQYGAAVRKVDDGIRFTAQMDASTYTSLEAKRSEAVNIEYGMLITTSKYAKQYAINETNVFGDNAAYYWDNQGTFTDGNSQTQNQVPIVNLVSSRMGRSATAKNNDPYLLYGSIIDAIPDDVAPEDKAIYMQGSYVGRAYIKYETINASGVVTDTEYAFAKYAADLAVDDDREGDDMANNTRSMFQVALNRISSGDEDAATLFSNYVDPVVGTSYTITKYADNHTGSNRFLEENDDSVDLVSALTEDGYTGQTVSIVKDANGKITAINCVLQPNDVVITARNTGDSLTIPGANFFWVTNSTTQFTNAASMPGVYYNATGADWTFSSTSSTHGEVAVLDSTCRVIEGRNGSMGKLVNEKNPVRVNAPQDPSLPNTFAMNITVPAGGYAIIVPTGAAYEYDRNFMNNHIINQYLNTVELTLKGASKPLKEYVDHSDVFGNSRVIINAGSFTAEQVKARLLSGMRIVDDKGTFTTSDDVNSGFNVNVNTSITADMVSTVGVYEISMTATSGDTEINFTRELEVITSTATDHDVRFYIKERGPVTGDVFQTDSYAANGNVYIDNDSTVDDHNTIVNSQFTIFSYDYLTSGYGASYTGNVNIKYGVAFLVNGTGKIVEIFDGAHSGSEGKYYGSRGYTCTNTEYTEQAITAFRSVSYSGGYIIIAPTSVDVNSTDASVNNNLNADGKRGSRTFLRDNLILNRYVECSKFLFTYNDAYTKGALA